MFFLGRQALVVLRDVLGGARRPLTQFLEGLALAREVLAITREVLALSRDVLALTRDVLALVRELRFLARVAREGGVAREGAILAACLHPRFEWTNAVSVG